MSLDKSIACILLGAPGSGKGTQAKRLQADLKIAHISTGDILRGEIAKASALGLRVKEVLASGQLVDDALIQALIKSRFAESDVERGYVLDGYPRNPDQVEQLETILQERHLPFPKVIYLKVDPEILTSRIVGRLSCSSCGAIFHDKLNPAKQPGVCDTCGGGLVRRKDDDAGVVQERLKVFELETAPLLALFGNKQNLYEVDGLMPIEDITGKLKEILKR